jgi:hypothetical protein
MEWADETRLRCLLVSSRDRAHLKTLIGMLHDHEIQTEEGLHRPWRSDSVEPSVMVAPEDFPTASMLYKESEIVPGTGPTLVSSVAPSRLTEPAKGKLLPEFFARHKQPEPTDLVGAKLSEANVWKAKFWRANGQPLSRWMTMLPFFMSRPSNRRLQTSEACMPCL